MNRVIKKIPWRLDSKGFFVLSKEYLLLDVIPGLKIGAESHAGSPNVIPGLKIGAESHAGSPNVIHGLKIGAESHAGSLNVIRGIKISAESHADSPNVIPDLKICAESHEINDYTTTFTRTSSIIALASSVVFVFISSFLSSAAPLKPLT